MNVKEYFFNRQCDVCGALLDEECWHNEAQTLNDVAAECDWKHLGGRDYCHDCWQWDDDDNIVTKDGRKFDGDTYERIRTGIGIDELGEKTQQQVNDGEVYKATADGGPTKHPERKTKWPWVLASEMLPTKSGHYVVCWEGQWHPAWFASEKDAIHNEPFFEIRKMGQIVYLKVYKNRFDQLWWRTIELPEEE